MGDPDFCDPKAAGWWVWGCSAWIGSGWCSGDGPWQSVDGVLTKVSAGQGINRQLPHLTFGQGINRQLPHLTFGQGINRQLPHLTGGRGINRQLPHLTGGRGEYLRQIFVELHGRLRDVRVACGDWSRVLGDSVIAFQGVCGIFLDPPYDDGAMNYSIGGRGIGADVREWCLANGDRPELRIALCGYQGDHEELEDHGWSALKWEVKSCYGKTANGAGKVNAARERIWFSPHCLSENQGRLF
jgi:hypothetical protein